MRYFAAAFLSLAVSPAFADEAPSDVNIAISDIVHVIDYLRHGGTRAEGDDLASKITEIVKADMAKQQAAKAGAVHN